MNKKKYLEDRKLLLDEAQKLIDEGKIEESQAKMKEIEALDNKWEEVKLANANMNALKDKTKVTSLEDVSLDNVGGKTVDNMSIADCEKTDVLSSEDYRNGFLKKLQGKELTKLENVAISTAAGSAGAVIPTETQNKIMEVIKQYAPLLEKINLLHVPGGVSIPVEDVVEDATKHAENATIEAAGDTITAVNLFGYEVTKLLHISKSVMKMSVSAFETWLSNNLGKSLARKISNSIIYGTGTGEAKGIDKITWNATNSVTVAKAAALSAQNVLDVVGLLPGGYDAGAEFIMSKKTLLTDFLPLQDKTKNDLVTKEGKNYFIQGYPVTLDERVTLHEAYLGDLYSGYYGNMPEEANVDGGFVRGSNNYEYLGACMFDGKPAIENAFVKIVKATV